MKKEAEQARSSLMQKRTYEQIEAEIKKKDKIENTKKQHHITFPIFPCTLGVSGWVFENGKVFYSNNA
jgi:hypothetical protein